MGNGAAAPSVAFARDRTQGRHERGVGDPMLRRAAGVAELDAADRAAILADAPIELRDADPLYPDLDRQCHARRHGHIACRRVRLERDELRTESAHDDAAGQERRRIPGERDVVRARVRVRAPPGDAPDAHGVEQRARGAVDLERAAASCDGFADDEIERALSREEEIPARR